MVSARKYRPLGFEEVVGQEHITTSLANAMKSNHLGQALLFCGPRGVGKTTCARILAKTINGFEHERLEGASNFNIFELDAASNNSVEDIRNLIDQVRYPPQQGKYKVYIIDEVHMLSNQAFNAFLKTLEEPPEYAIFILATTEKHKVIPTILSRCQIYDFNRIEVEDIVKQLEKIAEKEGVDAEYDALHLIAQKADGALRDALSMFDLITTFSSDGKVTYQDTIRNLHILDYDYYFKLVDCLLAREMSEVLLLFNEIISKGFDGNNFLTSFQKHLRNLLVSLDSKTVVLLEVSETLKSKYADQAHKCSQSFLLSALNICNQFGLNYKISKNQRLHVELCLMKLAHLPDALTLTVSSSEDGVKKKQHSEVTGEKKTPSVPKKENVGRVIEESIAKVATRQVVEKPIIPPLSIVKDSSGEVHETPSIFKKRKEEKNEDVPASVNNKKEAEYSEEALQKVWKQFQETRSNAEETEKLILEREVKKGENHEVLIFLSSQLEASFLEKFETDLIQYLRTELNNDHVSLSRRVAQTEEKKRLYTSKDIYNYMVKKNPELKELKDKLGLDFDY